MCPIVVTIPMQKKVFNRCELSILPLRIKLDVEILNEIKGMKFKRPDKKIVNGITKVKNVTNNTKVHPVDTTTKGKRKKKY